MDNYTDYKDDLIKKAVNEAKRAQSQCRTAFTWAFIGWLLFFASLIMLLE